MNIITISRYFASGGEEIAHKVAKKMGYLLVNKELIKTKLREYGIDDADFEATDEGWREQEKRSKYQERFIRVQHRLLLDLAGKQNLVVLGRGGAFLFLNHFPSLHIKITAPLKDRVEKVKEKYSLEQASAARLVAEQDKSRENYIRFIFHQDWADVNCYALCVNTGYLKEHQAVSIILSTARDYFKDRDVKQEAREMFAAERADVESLQGNAVTDALGDAPFFAHKSEEKFARMLDFYRIRWLYEPKTFPLEWDSEGSVTEAFAPDFYLPDLDLFVELTTQKQKLVWKKNKKLRRLKKLYPGVNVKILYGRSYKSILKKHGLED